MAHDDSSLKDISDAWIEMTLLENRCWDELFQRGFSLNDLAYDDPERAWLIIEMIMDHIDGASLYDDEQSKSKILASNLGAGPLETLVAQHGENFIDRLEGMSKSDVRMSWILGCMWKNAASDQIWERIRKAAGGISR